MTHVNVPPNTCDFVHQQVAAHPVMVVHTVKSASPGFSLLEVNQETHGRHASLVGCISSHQQEQHQQSFANAKLGLALIQMPMTGRLAASLVRWGGSNLDLPTATAVWLLQWLRLRRKRRSNSRTSRPPGCHKHSHASVVVPHICMAISQRCRRGRRMPANALACRVSAGLGAWLAPR